MSKSAAIRNLLFGIQALQMRFISRDQLVSAMARWVDNKSKSLDEFLLDSNALDDSTREVVLAVVEKQLEANRRDPQFSLATVTSMDSSLFEELKSFADSDIEASLSVVETQACDELVGNNAIAQIKTTYSNDSSTDIRYRVLRPHDKGGLGQVSVAFDKELNREVALKEIQDRFADHPEKRARFITEAEITGGLEHPGIVPVYGLGKYANGRPFYAMRFIRGDSLRNAADRFHQGEVGSGPRAYQSLQFRKLLGRFVDVCNAIEYAHSRGVLHRDLKPGNIMLGDFGETLVVDWGLSKVVGRDDVDASSDQQVLQLSSGSGTSKTQMGSAIGTPQYMSPEQAAGHLDQLGPASDVYSLGATLYYVLVGKSPFGNQKLDDLLSAVKSGEFVAPRESATEIPKPLEAVCLKAMSLESGDRYAAPYELADEIEHWLADEPVAAYPEPMTVRMWRWVKNHQAQVASAMAAILIGIVSLSVVLGVVARANRQLNEANLKLDDSNEQLADANLKLAERNADLVTANERIIEEEKKVREERDVATAINQFVRKDLLGQASPEVETDRDILLRTVLDRASENIGDRFRSQPMVEAAIANTLGDTYSHLGEHQRAETHLTRSSELYEAYLGQESKITLSSQNSLALAYFDLGKYNQAETLYLDLLNRHRQVYGEENDHTYSVLGNLGSLYTETGRYVEAEELHTQVLEFRMQEFGEENADTIVSMNDLAHLYQSTNRLDEALPLYQSAYENGLRIHGEEHPGVLIYMNNVATVLSEQGDWEGAERLLVRALEIHRRITGETHPITLNIMNNLAATLNYQSRHSEADKLFEEVLQIRRREHGDAHPNTIGAMSNLAMRYSLQRRYAEAESLFAEALEIVRSSGMDDHPVAEPLAYNYGAMYRAQSRFEEARTMYEEVLRIRRRLSGDKDSVTISRMDLLASLLIRMERFTDAKQLLQEAVDASKSVYGPDNIETLQFQIEYAQVLENLGELDAPLTIYSEILEIDHTANVLDSFNRIYCMGRQAYISEQLGRYEQAEVVRYEIVRIVKETYTEPEATRVNAVAQLGDNLVAQGKYAEAEPYLQECFDLCQLLAPNGWQSGVAQSKLGVSLTGQEKFDQAETVLISAIQLMRERSSEIPRESFEQLVLAIDRIVDLYDAWEKPTEADIWRTERLALIRKLGFVESREEGVRPPRPADSSN